MFEETPCVRGNNTCASGDVCASLWVTCTGQTQPYKYGPITKLFFGEKTCETPKLFRSICISKKKYDSVSLNLTLP
ncbi:MAG: hypothetical protein KAS12_01095 [Candidatus Aenigmarchaeota archaeon]|nr:hypothetical protein [Candidatus Aenigmarchaeota archaeon]